MGLACFTSCCYHRGVAVMHYHSLVSTDSIQPWIAKTIITISAEINARNSPDKFCWASKFKKFNMSLLKPRNWLSKLTSPISHMKNAGICTILKALIETPRSIILRGLFKSSPAEGHRNSPISVPAERELGADPK